MSKCPHYHIVVARSFDLTTEAASCDDCLMPVLDWKTRRHIIGKQSYRYVYVETGDFSNRKGALTSDERIA